MIVGLGRGVVIGTTVVFIGASIGSLLSFILGRYLLRDCVSKWLDRYSLFKAVDKTMEKKGFRIFCLLRLSPIIPYNALNYIAGATAVSFRDYTLALIGLLPGTALFVFVGCSAGSSMDMGDDSNDVERGARIASIVVGVAVGVLGIVVISCNAKRELNSIIAEQEQDNNNDGEQVELGQQYQEVISCDNERIDSTEILSER